MLRLTNLARPLPPPSSSYTFPVCIDDNFITDTQTSFSNGRTEAKSVQDENDDASRKLPSRSTNTSDRRFPKPDTQSFCRPLSQRESKVWEEESESWIPDTSATFPPARRPDQINRPSSSMLASSPIGLTRLDPARPRASSLSSRQRLPRIHATTTHSPKVSSPLNPQISPSISPLNPLHVMLSSRHPSKLTEAGARIALQPKSQSQPQKPSNPQPSTISFPKTFEGDPVPPRPDNPEPRSLMHLKRPLPTLLHSSPPSPAFARPTSQPSFHRERTMSGSSSGHRRSRTNSHRRRESPRPVQCRSVNSDDADDERHISKIQRMDPIPTMTEKDALIKRIMTSLETKDSYRPLLHALRDRGLAQVMMDRCQSVLDHQGVFETEFGRIILVFMQRLSKSSGAVPASYDLASINVEDENWVTAGTYGDIYETWYHGERVCAKKIRVVGLSVNDDKMKKLHEQLVHEGILWRQLRHSNVLPFYGVCMHTVLPHLISPWMQHGDINTYLKNYPLADRYLLLNDVLKGLEYLHHLDLVHGDLKGSNIVIDSCGHALLTDFGISSVFDERIPKWESHSTVASKGGTCRWQGPELFRPTAGDKDPYNTKESDVYAWACVCYEVFTGKLPFYEITRSELVMLNVMNGQKPSQPAPDDNAWIKWGLQEDFWSGVINKCWARQPSERPTVQRLLLKLRPLVVYDRRPLPREYESPARHRVRQQQRPLVESLSNIESLISAMQRR